MDKHSPEETARLANQTVKDLQKEFVVLNRSNFRIWHALLAIGVLIGAVLAIMAVASRTQ